MHGLYKYLLLATGLSLNINLVESAEPDWSALPDIMGQLLVMSCSGTHVNLSIPTMFIEHHRAFGSRDFVVGTNINDPDCHPETSDNSTIAYYFPLDSCTPQIAEVEGNATYLYVLRFEPEPLSGLPISRELDMSMEVTCYFSPDGRRVSGMYSSSFSQVNVATESEGTFNLQMNLLNLNGTRVNDEEFAVGDTLHVETKLLGADSLYLFVQTCVASPTTTVGNLSYTLIDGGCFNEADNSIGRIDNTDTSYTFEFDAFRFKTSAPGDKLYIICDVIICSAPGALPECIHPAICSQTRRQVNYDDANPTPNDVSVYEREASSLGSDGTYSIHAGPLVMTED